MNTPFLIYLIASSILITLAIVWGVRRGRSETTKWKLLYSKEALLREAEKNNGQHVGASKDCPICKKQMEKK
jgi:hypothetical protein